MKLIKERTEGSYVPLGISKLIGNANTLWQYSFTLPIMLLPSMVHINYESGHKMKGMRLLVVSFYIRKRKLSCSYPDIIWHFNHWFKPFGPQTFVAWRKK